MFIQLFWDTTIGTIEIGYLHYNSKIIYNTKYLYKVENSYLQYKFGNTKETEFLSLIRSEVQT